MAYLCMLHSKIPHGYVKAVHAEKALALPGVYGVYHCLNTSDRKYNRYRSNFDQSYLPNEECAFNDYVRFVGDKDRRGRGLRPGNSGESRASCRSRV